VPVKVSAMLFEAVRFAVIVAEESKGAFDPTIGHRMQTRGFNRNYRTGEIAPPNGDQTDDVSFRDLAMDEDERTITLRRPLTLDLGAVAKGLAADLAARELERFRDFAIDAGGDLYLGGKNAAGNAWRVGIRHPRNDQEFIESIEVSNQAVCTSGDYERLNSDAAHHIIDPRTGTPVAGVASVTVVAPRAMVADALATAAFVMGPAEGIDFLTRMGVNGLIVTTALARHETRGLCSLA